MKKPSSITKARKAGWKIKEVDPYKNRVTVHMNIHGSPHPDKNTTFIITKTGAKRLGIID